jgi:hypothetical protein
MADSQTTFDLYGFLFFIISDFHKHADGWLHTMVNPRGATIDLIMEAMLLGNDCKMNNDYKMIAMTGIG